MSLDLMMAAAKKRQSGDRVYATWNPLDMGETYTLSNSNRTITNTVGNGNLSARATLPKSSGKWYAELTANFIGFGDGQMGMADPTSGVLGTYLGNSEGTFMVIDTGQVYAMTPFSDASGGSAVSLQGDGSNIVLRMAIDLDNRKIWTGNHTAWSGNPSTGTNPVVTYSIPGQLLCIATRLYYHTASQTWNFGQDPFYHTVPEGFNAGWYEE